MTLRPTPYPRWSLCALLWATACTTPRSPLTPTPTPGDSPAIHWTRTAAEHRALFEQAYRWAGEQVAVEALGRTPGSWAVIVDVDETLLDTSDYQLRRARAGLGYSSESWREWVLQEEPRALPGAVRFLDRVRELGGRAAVVTNREESLCEATRRNLRAAGFDVDVVLCRQGREGKERRFAAVTEGTARPGLPPLDVVAWVGDNVEDFPEGSQSLLGAAPEALSGFGVRFFILPNPMYGSWIGNPPREP